MKSYLSISIPSIVSGNNVHNKKYNESDNAFAALESTATTVCENHQSEAAKIANNIDMESLDEFNNNDAPEFKEGIYCAFVRSVHFFLTLVLPRKF
jgi:hypothetical protein